MSAKEAFPWPAFDAGRAQVQQVVQAVFLFLPFLCGVVPILLYERVTSRLAWQDPAFATAGAIALALVCCLFAFVRYPSEARPARIVLVGLALAVGIFGFALGDELAVAYQERGAALGNGLVYARPILLATTLLAIVRPSFAVFPMVYFSFHKNATRAISSAEELGRNDYAPLVEVGLFLACGLIALGLLQMASRSKAVTSRLAFVEQLGTAEFASRSAAILLLAGIGAHFGNYFLSGWAKVTLDGGPLSWVLENPTSSIMLAGRELGAAPLAFSSSLFALAYQAFNAIEIPMNAVILAAQLFCFLAFLRRQWLIGLTAFFDLMHIGIFLLSGALFLHWIVLNSLVVAALTRTSERWFSKTAIATAILVTIFGHTVFYNAQLGWYDSRQIRYGYFEAATPEGDWVRVAPSFFRDASYLMYARHFGYQEWRYDSGHVPTSAWGQIGVRRVHPGSSEVAASNYGVMQLTKQCAYPVRQPETAPDYDVERPARFIRAQHERALTLAGSDLTINYNIYPHHHYSMPFLHDRFEALDPGEIAAYRYIVDTVCLEVADGEFKRRLMTRTMGPTIDVGR